jgi:hypothetical protein
VTLKATPVASGATITSAPDHVGEGSPVGLHLGAALNDSDGSESLKSVVISGVPAGATLTNATANADGTWNADTAHLGSVQLVAPAHFSGDVLLTVAATTIEAANGATATSTSTVAVHIDPVATAPTLAVQTANAGASGPIQLNIAAGLVDTDGSESLTVVVAGVPDGATLSAGLHNADGSYTLSAAHLAGLTLTAPANVRSDFDLAVTAVAHENLSGLDHMPA